MEEMRPKKYEVYHPESDFPYPKFGTWKEALAAQVKWNKDFPGHAARKIKKI